MAISVFFIFSLALVVNIGKCTNFFKENITVTIDQGTLFGKKSFDYWNDNFYSFEGIPYAKPPLGELRFKAPEPADPWTEIYDATQVRPICPQISSPDFEFDKNHGLEQNENCLFLSVHTKMSTELKPVMVWIHGGGMEFGSIFEDTYGPELLMTEDIVLVKIAYRLTVFGALSFEDPIYGITGNAGHKDQVLGLKWVQNNIKNFGGDPNQVTIFGESAGGSSVHLLYLSPLAKGLFHRAIVQSGAADEPWTTSPNKYPELARALKCKTENLDEIVNCINSSTIEEILQAHKIMSENEELNQKMRVGETVKFNDVTIEKDRENGFMSENPEETAKNGKFNKVPIMMGFTSHEGFLCINPKILGPNFTDSRYLIPKDKKIDWESEEAYLLGKKIQEFYYGNETPSYEVLGPFINFLTDIYILEKMYRYAKIQSIEAPDVPLYFYEFDIYTKLNGFQVPESSPKIVTHFDDVLYMFYIKNRTEQNLDPNSKEYIGIHRIVKLWTTFAKSKNGDPNPENDPLLKVKWLPVTSNKFNYLKISNTLELLENPAKERMQFWEGIYGNGIK